MGGTVYCPRCWWGMHSKLKPAGKPVANQLEGEVQDTGAALQGGRESSSTERMQETRRGLKR